MKGNKRIHIEIWFKLFLLVFFVNLYILAIPYPEKSKEFPHLIAVVSLFLIVLSLIRDFLKKEKVKQELTDVGNAELKVVDEETRKLRKRRFYQAWGILLVSSLIGLFVGFLFTTFFLFFGFALLSGKREDLKKNALMTVVITIGIYLVFMRLMDVPLLGGIIKFKFL